MAITPLPTPPSRQDPVNFNVRADEFLGALPTFGTEANSLATDVNNKQVTASKAATTATNAASTATTKAGEAETSAILANSSAILADSSAQVANIAKLAAEAALDSFDDRYMGAKSIPPTTDNDGNPLMVGALYWDSVRSEMKTWSGTAWVVTYGNLYSKYDKTGGTITGNVLVQGEVDGAVSIDVSNTDGVGLNAKAGLTMQTGATAVGYTQLVRHLNELQIGTSTNTSVGVYINNDIALRIGTDKSILSAGGALGYGVGAGGTVVQATSKSTTVILNKPTGEITMSNEALAAGASVMFLVNCSFFMIEDAIYAQQVGSNSYRVEAYTYSGGVFGLRVTNVTGSARADALKIRFVILKGASV